MYNPLRSGAEKPHFCPSLFALFESMRPRSHGTVAQGRHGCEAKGLNVLQLFLIGLEGHISYLSVYLSIYFSKYGLTLMCIELHCSLEHSTIIMGGRKTLLKLCSESICNI